LPAQRNEAKQEANLAKGIDALQSAKETFRHSNDEMWYVVSQSLERGRKEKKRKEETERKKSVVA